MRWLGRKLSSWLQFKGEGKDHSSPRIPSIGFIYTLQYQEQASCNQNCPFTLCLSTTRQTVKNSLHKHTPLLLQSEIKRRENLLKGLTLPLLLGLALPAILPMRPLLQPKQLAQNAAPELQIKPESRI